MDLGGTSDPYVKIYLLPDKKRKHETKVGIFVNFFKQNETLLLLNPKDAGKVRNPLKRLNTQKSYYFQKADIQATPTSGF